jgi:hypothetical protein
MTQVKFRISLMLPALFLILSSFLLCFKCGASEEKANAQQIARQAILLPRKDRTFEATITTKTANDTPEIKWGTHPLRVKFTRNPNSQEIRFEFPDSDESNLILIMPLNNRSEFVLYRGESKKSVTDLLAHVAESTFTYEDLTLQFLSWKNQEIAGHDTVKGRDSYKLISRPDGKTNTAYASVESWIDAEYKALMKAIAYDDQHQVVKEFNVRSLQQLDDDTWMLKALELRAPQDHARSELEILPSKKVDAR